MSPQKPVKRNGYTDRPIFTSYEQLKEWVDVQSAVGKELPWSKMCWTDAVLKSSEVKKDAKRSPVVDSSAVKGLVIGKSTGQKFSDDPLKNYFKLRGQSKYTYEDKQAVIAEIENKKEEIKQEYGLAVISPEKITDISEVSGTSKDTLWFENWINSFNPTEQEYLRSRFKNYMNDYEISAASDQSMFMQILATELLLYRMNLEIVNPSYVPSVNDTKQRDTLSTQLKNFLSEQQWTQKSQGKKNNDESRFTAVMLKWYNEGYTPPDIVVEDDEVSLIMRDIKRTIEDMRM